MTAHRRTQALVPPPVRAPRKVVPLTGQPIDADISPAVRPVEGEPLFVAIGQRAANERKFAEDGESEGNVAMLLATVVAVMAIAAVLAVIGFFTIRHYDNELVRLGIAGVVVAALSFVLISSICNRRNGAQA